LKTKYNVKKKEGGTLGRPLIRPVRQGIKNTSPVIQQVSTRWGKGRGKVGAGGTLGVRLFGRNLCAKGLGTLPHKRKTKERDKQTATSGGCYGYRIKRMGDRFQTVSWKRRGKKTYHGCPRTRDRFRKWNKALSPND